MVTILGLLVAAASFAAAAPAPAPAWQPAGPAASGDDHRGYAPLPNCRDVRFRAHGRAQNRNFTGVPLDDPKILRKLVLADEFPQFTMEGTQEIGALYCAPTVKNKNNDRMHFAVPYIAGNRNYWTAQGGSMGVEPFKPENYSWTDYFTAQGYAVLAIDRLGTGMSSKPDPVNTVQRPFEVELYHDIVQQIKKNATNVLPRGYQNLTYCGVSYGSVVGKAMSDEHPDDFDSIILQGFTYSIIDAMEGFFKVAPVPASQSDPLRYQNLPGGYLTLSYKPGVAGSYFGNEPGPDTYDAEVGNLFFQRQDLVAVGQFISTFLNISKADHYKGRVLVLTGENDQAFCAYGSLLVSEAHCGRKVADTVRLFPNADYNWYKPDNTGHVPNLFFSSAGNFDIARRFLDGEKIGHSESGETYDDDGDDDVYGMGTSTEEL